MKQKKLSAKLATAGHADLDCLFSTNKSIRRWLDAKIVNVSFVNSDFPCFAIEKIMADLCSTFEWSLDCRNVVSHKLTNRVRTRWLSMQFDQHFEFLKIWTAASERLLWTRASISPSRLDIDGLNYQGERAVVFIIWWSLSVRCQHNICTVSWLAEVLKGNALFAPTFLKL